MISMKELTLEEMEIVSGGRRMYAAGDYPHYCPECGEEVVVHTRDPFYGEPFYWEIWCPKCKFFITSYDF